MEKRPTDIQRPADCGRRTMRQNRKYGKPDYGETFQAVDVYKRQMQHPTTILQESDRRKMGITQDLYMLPPAKAMSC